MPNNRRTGPHLLGNFGAYMHLVVIITLALSAAACQPAAPPGARLITQDTQSDVRGFARADQPRAFDFPADHGPHPEYQTEWWYYTGNLGTDAGRRFGYQLTFFRRALIPPDRQSERSSEWSASQVYMAHLALTDIQAGEHQAFEKFSRGSAGLASAQASPFAVWLENWQVQEKPGATGECVIPDSIPCVYEMVASQGDLKLKFELVDRKGPVLQGDQGLSQKGPEAGQASYYYSLPRLETTGTITLGEQIFEVSGWSWMDHEFSTSALSSEQVGWDWFSIQLEDGRDLMVFQIRRADGTIDPFSSGTLIELDGSTRSLAVEDFQIKVMDEWISPHSGAVYPAGWQLIIPALGVDLRLKPAVSDQELDLSYAYWEGAVTVEGKEGSNSLIGKGYVELTGYSGSMGGEF